MIERDCNRTWRGEINYPNKGDMLAGELPRRRRNANIQVVSPYTAYVS
jgi:hypothetical protein